MKANRFWKQIEQTKPKSLIPRTYTRLVVGRRSMLPDGTPAVVGHVITVWWN